MKKSILLAIPFFISTVTYAQAVKPIFKPADFLKIKSLSEPRVSPDDKWVAYSLSEVDTAKDARVSHLWMQSLTTNESIELTHGADPASNPRWSPDGRYLAFLSSRDSKNASQVWLLDRRGGEAKKLTDIKGDLNDYSWSPDSKQLLLVIEDPESKAKEEPKNPLPVRIDRYHFKQDIEGYLKHQYTHLYLFNIEAKKLDTLTKGSADEQSPEWSPDGKRIAFVSNRTPEPERDDNSDIFTIEAKPNGQLTQLTTWKGHDIGPKWSPDGKHIAYLRSTAGEHYTIYDQDLLCIMDADGSNSKVITQQMDRPVSTPAWSKDSREIAFLVSDDRRSYLAKYDVDAKSISTINSGDYGIVNVVSYATDNWVVELSTPYMPNELFAVESGKLRKLTHHQNWLQEFKLAHVEGFRSKSKDGTSVSGLLYTPDSIHTQKLPFILFIHGGPVDQDDYTFDATRQILAGAGYAVAGVNYRGSNGRGLKYINAINADWGNKEVIDLLGAVDELVKKGIADPDHLGIGGWSYGGILTDYTIATDTRFKAGASGAGSALQTSMYGSDQYVLQYDNELGQPWKNQDKWIKLSYPFFHADRIKTPVLFMSGLKDFNVPTAGSEQMYMALKSQNLPTELILYPNQYHGITVPSYQVDRLQRYIVWFDKYLK
ncbi:S9 family peptidase [Mucilaginibacter xinganensis]|uniref:Acyl-peptide hydrolase n=1 Tax=Mucilaginibacter xinganensis TaxID=1234841 RepID=A0A223NWC9_9SPHI|nr:S9 family peptidase [Mucilaginibacter xinganensis]ASU34080.1 Prolyl tripeptidyl peptidase precursor [Mucilaginibacter xinganensis]